LASTLASHKQDAVLYEAFVYDTRDPAIVDYSNGRLFLLQRPDLTAFGDLCLAERKARASEVSSHRVAFYRYSVQQTPPVDAFFLQDSPGNQPGYEVIDFRHGGEALPYVRPNDLQPAESSYLDRVTAGLATLNADLDAEQQTRAPAGALSRMRQDFERIAGTLAGGTPPRLVPYRDSRLKRFLENYDRTLVAEESAARGQSGQAIHTTAYEQHREFYFQEPRVTRLIVPLSPAARAQLQRRRALDGQLGYLLDRAGVLGQDPLHGIEPALVALAGAPQPVLAAPEQYGAEAGLLEGVEQSADLRRAGAARVGVSIGARLPGLRLGLGDPGLLSLALGRLAQGLEPVRPVGVGAAEVVGTEEAVADGGVDVEPEHVALRQQRQAVLLGCVAVEAQQLRQVEAAAVRCLV